MKLRECWSVVTPNNWFPSKTVLRLILYNGTEAKWVGQVDGRDTVDNRHKLAMKAQQQGYNVHVEGANHG